MRQALLVGIDNYGGNQDLTTSKNDTIELEKLLGSGNSDYSFTIIRQHEYESVGKFEDELRQFFERPVDVSLFYFSGHGESEDSSKLLLSDYKKSRTGLEIYRLVQFANKSRARHRIIILDCCFAGALDKLYGKAVNGLEQNVTILASCQEYQAALAEKYELSLFTKYLTEALRGEAADERGMITMPAIFRHIDKAFKPNEQRPVFCCNCSEFVDIKRIDTLEAFNWHSMRIFLEIQRNYTKCHVTIVYKKEDYLKLLDRWLKKAEKEVLFTSSGIVDIKSGEIGKLQEQIIQSSKEFKIRNRNRLHLGIVGTGTNKYTGAVQLRSEVIDVALKFNPLIDRMSYNAFICDEKHVIIRLKNENDGLENYAISIENESLASRMREWFLSLWHNEHSHMMHFVLEDYLKNAPDHKNQIIKDIFSGDPRKYRNFQDRLLQIDLTYRIVGSRKDKVLKSIRSLELFENESMYPCIADLEKIIKDFYDQNSLKLTDIQAVISNIDQGNCIDYSLYSRAFTFQFFLANYYKVRHTFYELSRKSEFKRNFLNILDLGGGGGASLAALFDQLKLNHDNTIKLKVTIVDKSVDQINIAKQILERYPKVEFIMEEAEAYLKRTTEKFDLIISSNFLCEIGKNNRPNLIRLIAKQLTRDGYFAVIERVESKAYEAIMESSVFIYRDYKFVNERYEIPGEVFYSLESQLNKDDKVFEHVKRHYTLRYALCTATNT